MNEVQKMIEALKLSEDKIRAVRQDLEAQERKRISLECIAKWKALEPLFDEVEA